MCIYYKNNNNLTYKSREHIFPATIGGKEMLPLGYVSDQANNHFSSLESDLISNSFIGLDKSFYGPGKRGGGKPGRMPITLIRSKGSENLVFIFQAKPYHIPQIIISKDLNMVHFIRDFNIQTNKDFDKLIDAINNYNGKYTLITAKPQNEVFLIGLYNKRLYISINEKDRINNFIEYIKKNILNKIDYSAAEVKLTEQPNAAINMTVSIDNNPKVFAKTAINVLAKIKGSQYIQQNSFKNFINWILGISKCERFEQLPQNINPLNSLKINDKTHYCVLMNVDGYFVTMVSFYNYWTMGFNICKAFDKDFNVPYVYFCDWQNKKEYDLLTYLNSLHLKESNLKLD